MGRWNYDVAVIGAGTAGLVAADFAVKLGARTVLFERERIGGDCTWTGCVPSKALIRAAHAAHAVRTAARFGVTHTVPPSVTADGVRRYVHGAIAAIYQHETPDVLRQTGLAVRLGAVRFSDPHTLIDADGKRITARKLILATGAGPRLPDLPGLNTVPYWTYRSLFDLTALPTHLIIIGTGPIGVEMAQAFARLGSAVTLIGETLLPRTEPEAAERLARILAADGVTWQATRAVHAQSDAAGVRIGTADGGAVTGSHLLIATGRVAQVDGLDLDAAGVQVTERGLVLDDRLRTSQPHIFAAGDCTGGPQFTHVAGWQGYVAVRNALLPLPVRGTVTAPAWTLFTDPAIAQLGLTEAAARQQHGERTQVRFVPGTRIDRAVVDDEAEHSFVKVIADRRGKILGVTIMGTGAGDALTEWTLAQRHQIAPGTLATALHVYPTYATASQLIASGVAGDALLTGWVGRGLRWLAKRQ